MREVVLRVPRAAVEDVLELEMSGETTADGLHFVTDEAAAYEPARTDVEFSLGTGGDRVAVKVLLGTLQFADRGAVRITAQAIVRQAPVS